MTVTHPKILLVDDDADLLELLSLRLTAAGYAVEVAGSAETALNLLDVSRPQLVITDMRMDGMDGMALFEHIHRTTPTLPVIILTAHGTIPDAVAAAQRGVFGYLAKPFDSKSLLAQVAKGLRLSPNLYGGSDAPSGVWRDGIVTHSAVMEDLLTKAKLVAEGDASVLIHGESGTGKELLAHAIHDASHRSQRPFVAVNCAAIPEQLLESELFGHVKGAFTGAVRDHMGLFQKAEGGTLFLDEIGDMPLLLQVKLLRVLQERHVRPVGSAHTIPVDVRIISATHRDLDAEVAAGHFREDLYYRLHVVALTIPALSQRREDIPLLTNYFIGLLAKKYRKSINGVAPEAMELLVGAAWPGNVRQLMNVVEQCVVLSTTPLISPVLVHEAMHKEEEQLISFEEARKQFEREYLVRVLKMTAGNVTQAARLAKRNRTEFYKLLQRHSLDAAVFKRTAE
ncbi:MAG: sigma 54-interacting transcriptional regulator [Sulfuriferula sp.]|nr:sigma 54-interacting transcriptional regulator [Sulfuriferula sp.]